MSFARQHPDIFTEKPRDPPDYKEDPDRTNDLEQMEAELNGLKEILVASSTRREVIAVNSEEEQAQGSPNGLHPGAADTTARGLCKPPAEHKPPRNGP